jgi:uncharacterized membrane protein YfcA
MQRSNGVANGAIGLAVGIVGGLVGLGGAELRLPYLVGVLRLTTHQAVPINLVVSLFTIVAAIPVRLAALPSANLEAFATETFAIAAGAIVAAYVGVGLLRRLSAHVLGRVIFILLVALGLCMIVEAFVELAPIGLLPAEPAARIVSGIMFGFLIGAISSVLGVAGGEAIIPTLVLGFGVPVKSAGSLSMLISLPTVLTGIVRHARAGAFGDRHLFFTVILPMGATRFAPIPNAFGLGFASTPGDYRDNIVRVGFNYRFGPRGGPGLFESPLPARDTFAFNSDFLPNLQFATDRANMQVAAASRARSPDHAQAKPVVSQDLAVQTARAASEVAVRDARQASPRQGPPPRQVASATNESQFLMADDDVIYTDDFVTETKPARQVAKKRPDKEEDESARMKRIMSICSGC